MIWSREGIDIINNIARLAIEPNAESLLARFSMILERSIRKTEPVPLVDGVYDACCVQRVESKVPDEYRHRPIFFDGCARPAQIDPWKIEHPPLADRLLRLLKIVFAVPDHYLIMVDVVSHRFGLFWRLAETISRRANERIREIGFRSQLKECIDFRLGRFDQLEHFSSEFITVEFSERILPVRAISGQSVLMKSEKEGQESDEHLQAFEPQRSTRPVILVFSDFYLPGYKSGGGMRTLVNIVDRFGDDYDFRIVTRDHDGKTDKVPYPNISYEGWTGIGKSMVRYLAKDRIRIGELRKIIKSVSPDIIFFNSYFSTLTIFVLLLRRIGFVKRVPMIIAPQGELSDGALGLKPSKKTAFLRFASRLGLYRDIVWRATSDVEADEIERSKGRDGRIFVAADMSPAAIFPGYDQVLKPLKDVGSARFIFLARIHPIKNLAFLLGLFDRLAGAVNLDIIGPYDPGDEYFLKCMDMIDQLQSNVRVNLVGEVAHEKVFDALVRHHFFVLPSLSENFGHVFLEAMASGCPLIISDRTPWGDLETKQIGWDISLDDRTRWLDILDRCIDMDQETFAEMSRNARRFAESWIADETVEKANRDVFEYALSLNSRV